MLRVYCKVLILQLARNYCLTNTISIK